MQFKIMQKYKGNFFLLTVCCVLIVEFLFLLHSNLTQMQYHIGYDASYFYNKAIEIWKQKSLLLQQWSDQTALNFDTSVVFAALLYGLTGNIFVSYGIVNMFFCICIMLVVYYIAKELMLSLSYRILAICLIICPYITIEFNNANDLGYYSMLLGNCQAYAGRILLSLLILLISIQLYKGYKNKIVIAVSCLWALVCGISSGVYVIMMMILPILFYLFLKFLFGEKIKNIIYPGLYLLLNAIIIVLGKFLQAHVFEFEARDNAINLIHIGTFLNNIGSILLGFFQLIGVLPTNADISVTSMNGLLYLWKIIYVSILIISIVVVVKCCRTNLENVIFLPLTVVGVNVLMFAVGSFTYGSQYFEARYLIQDYILLAIFICIYLDKFSAAIKWKNVLSLAVCLGTLICSISSYAIYYNVRLDIKKYQYVISKINKIDSPVAFVSKNLGIDGRNLDVFLDNKNIKVFSVNDSGTNVVEDLWGCSTAYGENAQWTGENILICEESEFDSYPASIQRYYQQVGSYDNIRIYYAATNVLDFNSNIIYDKVNLFPYSPGVITQNGKFEEKYFVSDGSEGYILYGPYGTWNSGKYKVSLRYSVENYKDKQAGLFDLATDNGNRILASASIENGGENISFDVEVDKVLQNYELRCYAKEGAIIKIERITVEKID